ncbi:MAG: hypothetical protein JW932_10925 [Deltaproteobacteria bacterium]|nr:hypothetical protein [Deltaproteobacteria bacterium]
MCVKSILPMGRFVGKSLSQFHENIGWTKKHRVIRDPFFAVAVINSLKIVFTVRRAEKPMESGLHLSACWHAQAGRNDEGVDNYETVNNNRAA